MSATNFERKLFFENYSTSLRCAVDSGFIHVWRVTGSSAHCQLTSVEAQMAHAIPGETSKRNFVLSRWALRLLTEIYTGTRPQEEFISKGMHWKPHLRDFPDLHFSLSHTVDEVVLGFANQPLGLDVENPTRRVEGGRIARRFFHPEEWPSGEICPERFFTLWTAKEAMLKLDGRGISGGLQNARVQDFCTGILAGRTVVLNKAEWPEGLLHVATWRSVAGVELRTLATPELLPGDL